MVLETRKRTRKEEQEVKNTQTLKSGGKGCKKKKVSSFKNIISMLGN